MNEPSGLRATAAAFAKGGRASRSLWRGAVLASLSAWLAALASPTLAVFVGAIVVLGLTRLAANRLRDAGRATIWAFAPSAAWITVGLLAATLNWIAPRHAVSPLGLVAVDVASGLAGVLSLAWAAALALLPARRPSDAGHLNSPLPLAQ